MINFTCDWPYFLWTIPYGSTFNFMHFYSSSLHGTTVVHKSSFRWEEKVSAKFEQGYHRVKGTLVWDILVLVHCMHHTCTDQRIRLLSDFFYYSRICWDIKIFIFSADDSIDVESHSPSTVSTKSETQIQLSQRRVELNINWINAEWTKFWIHWLIVNLLSI